MTVDEANAVIDRLNAVNGLIGSDIPTAEELFLALTTLIKATTDCGGERRTIPPEISETSMVMNKDIAVLVEDIREYANLAIKRHNMAAALNSALGNVLPPAVKKRIKI